MKKRNYSEFQKDYETLFELTHNQFDTVIKNKNIDIDIKKKSIEEIFKNFNNELNTHIEEIIELKDQKFFNLKIKELRKFLFTMKESFPSRNDLKDVTENSTDEETAKIFFQISSKNDNNSSSSDSDDGFSTEIQSFTQELTKEKNLDDTLLHEKFLIECTKYRKILREKVKINFNSDEVTDETITPLLKEIDEKFDSDILSFPFFIPIRFLYKIYNFIKIYGIFYFNKKNTWFKIL